MFSQRASCPVLPAAQLPMPAFPVAGQCVGWLVKRSEWRPGKQLLCAPSSLLAESLYLLEATRQKISNGEGKDDPVAEVPPCGWKTHEQETHIGTYLLSACPALGVIRSRGYRKNGTQSLLSRNSRILGKVWLAFLQAPSLPGAVGWG